MSQININKELDYFNDIYANSEKFNLTWAFKDAQDRANNTFKTICSENNNVSCSKFKEAVAESEDLSGMKKCVFKFTKSAKWYGRIFNNIQNILTVMEIVFSVLLVMIVSSISHQSQALIESEVLSLMVVVLFALFKVFAERLILQPKFEEWGWKAYASSYKRLYATLAYALDMPLTSAAPNKLDKEPVIASTESGYDSAVA